MTETRAPNILMREEMAASGPGKDDASVFV